MVCVCRFGRVVLAWGWKWVEFKGGLVEGCVWKGSGNDVLWKGGTVGFKEQQMSEPTFILSWIFTDGWTNSPFNTKDIKKKKEIFASVPTPRRGQI